MSINTDLLHAEQLHAKLWGSYEPVAMAHVSPIYQTSTYVLENFDAAVYLNQHADAGFSYTRFANPNCDELERKIAHLEHAEAALALASGLGAISTAVMSVVKAGDHVVFGDVIYGCSYALFAKVLTKLGVTYTRVDTTKVEEVEKAIQPNTSLVYVETPANPTLKISDIAAIAEAVHKHPGITMIVDSTLRPPTFRILWIWVLTWWSTALPSTSMATAPSPPVSLPAPRSASTTAGCPICSASALCWIPLPHGS